MFAVFFFFKQKTAYEMRISDWSSDVCSSDQLDGILILLPKQQVGVDREFGDERSLFERGANDPWFARRGQQHRYQPLGGRPRDAGEIAQAWPGVDAQGGGADQIGRASCRARVCQSV